MSTEMREVIAKGLKRLRMKSGLTAAQVGEIVGKSKKTISAWENNHGQPDAEMLMQLCDIYGVDNILDEFRLEKKKSLNLTSREEKLIIAYRSQPELQSAVERFLGLPPEEEKRDLA